METIKIYVSTHKVFNPIYTSPIYEIVAQPQVDIEEQKKITNLVVHKMTDEHMFYRIPRGFSDIANIHFVWKHCEKTKYIGFAQYGAELSISNPVDDQWINEIMKDYSAVCLNICFGPISVRHQFEICSYKEHFDILYDSVVNMFPGEKDKFDEYCNCNSFANGDMFIMKYDDFDNMMRFIDIVMNDVVEKIGLYNDDDLLSYAETLKPVKVSALYQSRIYGYLSERLIGFFLHKMKNKYIVPIHDFETGF